MEESKRVTRALVGVAVISPADSRDRRFTSRVAPSSAHREINHIGGVVMSGKHSRGRAGVENGLQTGATVGYVALACPLLSHSSISSRVICARHRWCGDAWPGTVVGCGHARSVSHGSPREGRPVACKALRGEHLLNTHCRSKER